MKLPKFVGFLFFACCVSVFAQTNVSLTDDQRFNITFEALSRLQSARDNPKVQAIIEKTLARTRSTPHFVQLVKQLGLKDQDEELLEVAQKFSATESGVEAMRLILINGNSNLVEKSLQDSRAIKVVEALGNTGKKEAVAFLLPIVMNKARDLKLRNQAVRAAAQTSEGAEQLLKLAKKQTLLPDLKLVTSAELNAVRWEKIKEEAAKVLPLPQSSDARVLPSVADLLKMKGDGTKGEKIFLRAESACSTCHQIKGKGGEIGPALTEIGTKLGKEALLESILDPSAGISFGFEAHQIELKSGDEAYGLIVSETAEELVMKDSKGIAAHYTKGEIVNRQQLKTSIMPTGLEQMMSAQELVDLVEYLSTLRKAN